MSKLKLNAIGHLGRDCSVKHLDGGNCAINFSIACTDRYKDKQGNQHEKTTWVDCVIWRKPDNIRVADYLKKGQLVAIEGKPEVRAYNSKEGEARAVLSVRVDELDLLGKSTSDQSGAPAVAETAAANSGDAAQSFGASEQEDDLPF